MLPDTTRETATSLTGYSIETIIRQDSRPIIMRCEWLGTMGRTTFFVGLLSPTRELHGVVCFGYGPPGPIRKLIGESAFTLVLRDQAVAVRGAQPDPDAAAQTRTVRCAACLTRTWPNHIRRTNPTGPRSGSGRKAVPPRIGQRAVAGLAEQGPAAFSGTPRPFSDIIAAPPDIDLTVLDLSMRVQHDAISTPR
jgi:hypothetical protein